MQLTRSIDFTLLKALEDGRNLAVNLSIEIGLDCARTNTRLSYLEDHGLVKKIGPTKDLGLYELTARGKAAIKYRDVYNDVGPDGFSDLVNDSIANP